MSPAKSSLSTCIHRVKNLSTKIVTFRHLGKIICQTFLAFSSSYASAMPNVTETPAEEVSMFADHKIIDFKRKNKCICRTRIFEYY